jgi:hypothetical protein
MGKLFGALALVALVGAVPACEPGGPPGVPSVATTDLQSDISSRMARAGRPPQSVTCLNPLVGEVGQTARCEVVISPTNMFEPIVRVTGVSGSRIEYEMMPALNKGQLEQGVTRLLTDAGSPPAAPVVCQSGLLGMMGSQAYCEVTAAGVTLRRTAEVTNVKGLMMNFDLVPMLTKAEVERSFLDELAKQLGKRPESATCAGDLEGRPGNTVDCRVTSGPDTGDFRLTVTAINGQEIDYTYAARP